jgi:tetratricopeptide (TPR) repeat protein
MTHELARPFFNLPPERYHFTPFGSLSDYLRFLQSVDVGIVPLLHTDYNRCRSDVKFLEYASQGVVGIYADLEPYRASVVHGQTGLLYRRPADLIENLERLRNNASARNHLRQHGYEYVRNHRMLPNHIGNRLSWYRSLLADASRITTLTSELAAAAVAVGRHLQMKPGAPERILLTAQQTQDPGEAISLLAPLVEQQPHYLAALQALGQLLNTVRDHRRAFNFLEQALALDPHSARTRCEIGRTWYWLRDLERAKAVLKEAVETCSLHLPAWQYLLRLLAIDRSADGPEWARRADARFPSCYSLALLGTQCYPPTEIAAVLSRHLDRVKFSITEMERPIAQTAFREAVLSAIQIAPPGKPTVSLLERACEVFPESARLASELGTALEQAGRAQESYRHQARAWRLSRRATCYKQEYPGEQVPNWSWQLADCISRQAFAQNPANINDAIIEPAFVPPP